MNALKRSVVGLSFDFAVISFVSFACYTAFNCVMYWSASVRSDYE
jgi:hypothetical protein